ncbi:MAG: dienelactone hydrolase family protein [Jannaschia helgolandensis]
MGKRHVYKTAGETMVGYRAKPDAPNGAGLLIAPAFCGLREFEMKQADRFAALGYDVLAVDYYGDGWRTEDADAASVKMATVQNDRAALLRRMRAALAEVRGWGPAKVGAMGFCLGGKAVLDLARAGDGDAAVLLHGVYDRPPFETVAMPPVLLCYGWNDPLALPAQFGKLAAELDEHSSDWHALCFGRTGHAFTNPARADGTSDMGYVKRSADRSWAAVEAFLAQQLT